MGTVIGALCETTFCEWLSPHCNRHAPSIRGSWLSHGWRLSMSDIWKTHETSWNPICGLQTVLHLQFYVYLEKSAPQDWGRWSNFMSNFCTHTLSQYQRQACHSPMKSEMNGCARCHGPWALGCLLCHRVDHDVWTTGRGTQRRRTAAGQWRNSGMPGSVKRSFDAEKTEEKFPQKGLKAKIDFRSPIFDTVLVLSFLGPVSSFHAHNEGLAYLLSRCLEWPIFVWESRYGMSPNWFGQQKTKSFRRMFTFFGRLPCF